MKKTFLFLLVICSNSIIFAQSNMNFQAEIANRNGDIIYIKDNNNKVVIQEIKVDDKGVFKSSFDVKEDFYVLYDGLEYTQLYLKAGDDLHLTMDAKNFDESIIYSGKGAEENNFLAQIIITNAAFQEKNLQKTKDDYYVAFDAKKKQDLENLEKSDFSDSYKLQAKRIMMQGFLQMQMEYKQAETNNKLIGKPSPTFEYVNYNGEKSKLEDFKGKYVYIDVWATWCAPCRGEIPFLQKVEEKYKGKNIAFISISIDQEKDFEKWKNMVKDKQLGGTQLFADKDWNSDFAKALGINAIPRFILIDPKGIVIDANAARPSEPNLQEQLDKLLKK